MIPLSVLDLSPIIAGGDAGQSLRNTLDLARHAEDWGYNRYWLAEHHNIPGVASAATAVIIGQVGAVTSRIRIGAGGIMLPNHAPLVIAEQFGTLAALFPGRVDLGLGRAPGSDQITARALRRTLDSDPNGFPRDVVELMSYFRPAAPGQAVQAVPGAGLDVPIWILGSSLFGAQLAAHLGLPYAFASHFAPGDMMQAIEVYREMFQPSAQLDKPYVMLGFNVFAGETDEEGALLATSQQQAFVNLRRGTPVPLQPPLANYLETLDPGARAMVGNALSCSATGSPETVRHQIEDFIRRTDADELMLTGQIFDHQKRLRSFEIVAGLREEIEAAQPVSQAG